MIGAILTVELDRARINVLGGLREIGGNCVIVEGEDGTVVFDQGISFNALRRYFSGHLKPRGVSELRQLRVLPDLSMYREADVFITHLHLDHVGLLGNLEPGTRLYVPDAYQVFIEWFRNRPDWLTYMEPRVDVSVDYVKPGSRYGPVSAYLVKHSAYPAYAYLYDNGYTRILYTGDLRIDSPLWYIDRAAYGRVYTSQTLTDLEGLDVDLLIIEGTNYTGKAGLITGDYLATAVGEVLAGHEGSLVFMSIDHMDIDLFLSSSSLALSHGRLVIVTSRRLVDMVNYWYSQGLVPENLAKEIHLAEDDVALTELMSIAVRRPSEFVVFAAADEVIDVIRSVPDGIGRPRVLVSMEAEVPERTGFEGPIAEWLSLGRVISYRLRLSGHYYPSQLSKIIKIANPRQVIPIHTEEPELLCMHAKMINNHVKCVI